jgi:hypothetical protein
MRYEESSIQTVASILSYLVSFRPTQSTIISLLYRIHLVVCQPVYGQSHVGIMELILRSIVDRHCYYYYSLVGQPCVDPDLPSFSEFETNHFSGLGCQPYINPSSPAGSMFFCQGLLP